MKDCDKCREYILDSKGEKIKNLVTGKPIRRAIPPKCEICNKGVAGFEGGWKYNNEIIFDTYRLSAKFHKLPREGGIYDQQPEIFELFNLLSMIQDR